MNPFDKLHSPDALSSFTEFYWALFNYVGGFDAEINESIFKYQLPHLKHYWDFLKTQRMLIVEVRGEPDEQSFWVLLPWDLNSLEKALAISEHNCSYLYTVPQKAPKLLNQQSTQ